MSEHPILFTGEMVPAILDNRKTQTRRVMKPQPPGDLAIEYWCDTGECRGFGKIAYDKHGHIVWPWRTGIRQPSIRCPYGVPGGKLWVRETWASIDADHPKCPDGRKPQPGDRLVYRANLPDAYQWGPGLPSQGSFCWRSSIHMPRWASRLTLEVVEVRVQQVQEISEGDCWAEGISREFDAEYYRRTNTVAHAAFATLWDSINGKRGFGWDSNPWVWCVTFKQLTEATEG